MGNSDVDQAATVPRVEVTKVQLVKVNMIFLVTLTRLDGSHTLERDYLQHRAVLKGKAASMAELAEISESVTMGNSWALQQSNSCRQAW